MGLALAPMLFFVLAAGTTAASPCWTGTWRLDRDSSRLRGELTVVGGGPGGYIFDFGATRFVVKDDGRFHPTVAGRETSLAAINDRQWKRVHRIRGLMVDQSLLTLSPDGQVLTIVTSTPDGPSTTEELHRAGSGRRLEGAWRSARAGGNVAETLAFAALGDGRLPWGSPKDGNYYVVRPDGPAAANEGPTSVPGVSLTVRAAGLHRIDWIEAINGKPYTVGSDELSADGTTMTETTRPAARPSEVQVGVYKRQASE